jgi:hypothetical protein
MPYSSALADFKNSPSTKCSESTIVMSMIDLGIIVLMILELITELIAILRRAPLVE